MNRSISTVAILLGASWAVACGGGKPAQQGQQAPPPSQVTVATLAPQTIEVPFTVPGRLQGSREVEVRSRVKGILQAWAYKEGEPVKEGQLLFRIDPASYVASADRAKGVVGEAEAALARAERDVNRLGPLAEREAVSRRELDDATSTRDQAKANLESARAGLRSAELELGYTRVVAPVSGISGRALKSQGSLVNDGDDSLLTSIWRIDPIWALFTLSDREFARMQAELTRAGKTLADVDAQLVLADGTTAPRSGKLNFTGTQIDSATGSVELRAEFPNADAALLPGLFVRVVLKGVSRAGALVVPQRAVQAGPQGRYVYVVGEGDKVEARPVVLEEWSGSDWIVASGLAAGERVIVDGALKVGPGATVQVVDAAAPAAGAGGAEAGAGS
ncbi:MAG: efflux RND transporter periplasmic adaptor subunit [Thermoanaerobaculia bacterium]